MLLPRHQVTPMNVVMTKKDRELLGKLHRLVGSDNAKEAEAARKKLVELLKAVPSDLE